MTLNKQILSTFIILVVTIIFFGISDIDYKVQDLFFDSSAHIWLLDRNLEPYKFIFYDGIKRLLILVAFVVLAILIFYWKSNRIKKYKQGLLILILSAIFVPVTVGILKQSTNMPCPKNEIHYGGNMIKTVVWKSYSPKYKKMDRISCWPAGHASGGFALLSLFFIFEKRKNKFLALSFGFVIGWIMGIYKMLIGDHFLSHTVISMILAWLVILIIRKGVQK